MSLLEFFGQFLILAGSIVLLVAAVGLLRFPDFFTRLHAAGVIDTLGLMLMIAGMVMLAGLSLVSIKLLLILVFILLSSPTASHALAKAALHGGLRPKLADKPEDTP